MWDKRNPENGYGVNRLGCLKKRKTIMGPLLDMKGDFSIDKLTNKLNKNDSESYRHFVRMPSEHFDSLLIKNGSETSIRDTKSCDMI